MKSSLTAGALALGLLVGCATPTEPLGPTRPETVFAVTDAAELIRFNAGQPQKLLQRQPLLGLDAGDRLVGMDYRVSRGVLFALAASGRLYTLNTDTAQLTRVGNGAPVALQGERFGVDFNPVADRVRVVSDRGQNLRLHPDAGVLAATDPPLRAASGTGPLDDASFDIADRNNAALAVLRSGGHTRLFAVDLATDKATLIGSVGTGRALWRMAIAP